MITSSGLDGRVMFTNLEGRPTRWLSQIYFELNRPLLDRVGRNAQTVERPDRNKYTSVDPKYVF